MYYEINVSLKGKHLFATHERSIVNNDEYRKVMEIFEEKFPKSEGFNISVTKWELKGEIIKY